MAEPAWQLRMLFDGRAAAVVNDSGHWSIVVPGQSSESETLDGALCAVAAHCAEDSTRTRPVRA